MYKWLVDIILKSGKTVTVLYEGPEKDTTGVANKIVAGGSNSMNGFMDTTGTHNILVMVGEIAALDISVWKG